METAKTIELSGVPHLRLEERSSSPAISPGIIRGRSNIIEGNGGFHPRFEINGLRMAKDPRNGRA